MKDQLISLATAKLAKEVGFVIPSKFSYREITKFVLDKKGNEKTKIFHSLLATRPSDNINKTNNFYAPTQSLLQKWLREVKDENIVPPLWFSYNGYACDILGFENTEYFKTYEEALENELFKCLQRVSPTVA